MRTLLALSAILLAAPSGPAQEQPPRDARGLVQWHLRLAPTEDADELLHRAWVYQRAGAEGEAWAALEGVAARRPDDPDLLRFRARLSAWDPDRWRAGLADAERWSAEFGPSRSEAERGAVAELLDELRRRVSARDAVGEGRRTRALAPLVALAVGLLAVAFAHRRMRSEAP